MAKKAHTDLLGEVKVSEKAALGRGASVLRFWDAPPYANRPEWGL